MRVDGHVHLLPDAYRRELESRELAPYPLPTWSPELSWEMLERHTIDAAVFSLAPPGVWFDDAGLAVELARMVNESTAEFVRSAPDRIAGLAVLPLPDVDASLDELEYALDTLALDGVGLFSNVDGIYHGDPRLAAVWDELDRRGAYVFLHPAAPPGAAPLPEYPVWLYEFPFDTTRSIVNLIYSGTIGRCRAVRLQVAHLGGAALFLAHRIASLALREPHKAAAAPAGALAALQQMWFDTGLSNHEPAVRSAVQEVPLQRILFGTDWPYAALPDSGDPAPELDFLGSRRALVDASNIAALVPRLFDPGASAAADGL